MSENKVSERFKKVATKEEYKMNEFFVNSIKKTGFSIEEISGLSGIPEYFIYRFARELQEPDASSAHILASIIGEPIEKLFPNYEED